MVPCRRCWLFLLASMLMPIAMAVSTPAPSSEVPSSPGSPSNTAPVAPQTSDTAAASPAAEPAAVQAIWKSQEITFYFQSFNTFYSCSALEDKVARILRPMAAEVEVRVRSADCGLRVADIPYVIIDITSAVEATPQALAEQDKTRPTRELAARVRGERAQGTDANGQFAAQWKRISLNDKSRRVEGGDCELLEQIKRKVLPQLNVRVVDDRIRCNPNSVQIGRPELEVEALVALPKPDAPAKPDSERR